MRFLISPLVSTKSFLTHAITVAPGGMVRVTVAKQLALTTFTVSDQWEQEVHRVLDIIEEVVASLA